MTKEKKELLNEVIRILETKINSLKDEELQAKDAKEYYTCILAYGASIQFQLIVKELEEMREKL